MKKERMEEIEEEIRRCNICKKGKTGLPVPGEGNLNSKIVFVGMAPGRNESKVGRPFVGMAGRNLELFLSSINLRREEVYLTSPVKYYPGKRLLRDEEILHGMEHLRKQIDIIDPKIIVLLGEVAYFGFFRKREKITKIHGKVFREGGRIYFVTFHPAAARFPKIKKLMQRDFRKLSLILKKIN
jgi:uracil-DNA glycosylase family 4